VTAGETTEPTGGPGTEPAAGGDLTLQWVLPNGYGERHFLRGTRLRIGRGPDCHLRLEHASVSRAHAELYRQGPIHALRDLGSRNGTHLNGRRVDHGVVSNGDVVRVGDFVGVVGFQPRSVETVPFGEFGPGLLGGTTLAAALSLARTAATTDIPILIVGPTGCGKERVARAIHAFSGRKGRFHAINCAALPASLAESELFGHERGAFTGAERAHVGHLRAAHGGTLFLDEVTELPLGVQAKLLRALQEREVMPLGATDPLPIDVRVVVAAQQPLEQLVDQRTFREDLYARLAGVTVTVPPLSKRRDEIPGLLFHFIAVHGNGRTPTIQARLMERLCLHEWSRNVRELELFVRTLLATTGTAPVLGVEHTDGLLAGAIESEPPQRSVERFEERRDHDRHRLTAELARNGGNMSAAAASVGISRRRAYRLLASQPPGSESSEDVELGADVAGDT
jgi:transcriptional regulator of acetoin/glycerol metabolism